ncbi:tape measure protein, partial [uncultured Intestinimonas sp.]|uniref:tape measure protein n=1 Tax=uncultured Intestinimonas sp. TaxID=1689265 RepID=UPI0029439E7A
AISKADNRAGGGSGVLSALGQAGVFAMAGNVASQWADVIVGSSFGGELGGLFSGALSGAASGASLGTLLGGPVGTAMGAAIGGALGLAGGAAQSYQSQDQAFMGYYGGLYETASQSTEASREAGSSTATQRELDAIAFNRLLGEGVGDQYLKDLRAMAAETPMEYGDLTAMSRALATGFGDSPERMLELMRAIGDAGSAVGVTASDMSEMARAMSRMNSSGKATLEFLNIFQDRGVDVIDMLGEAMGKTQGEIYNMISKGQINGQDAASIIQAGMESQYSGAMGEMSRTYEGLTSTLADAMTELDNATGEGYNRMAAQGIQADIDAYGGELGEALAAANEIIGEGKAIAENLDRQYSREALSTLTLGTDTTVYGEEQAARLQEMHGQYTDLVERYQTAAETDKAIIAGEIEALKEKAQAMADASYDASSMAQSLQDVELGLIASIRDLTDKIGSVAWGRDYEISQELGKGQMAVSDDGSSTSSITSGYQVRPDSGIKGRYAYGLDRVPYDNYAALLHEGERVLTAREAREQDQSGGLPPISISVSGNTFGAGMDEAAVAEAIAQAVSRKLQAGFQV